MSSDGEGSQFLLEPQRTVSESESNSPYEGFSQENAQQFNSADLDDDLYPSMNEEGSEASTQDPGSPGSEGAVAAAAAAAVSPPLIKSLELYDGDPEGGRKRRASSDISESSRPLDLTVMVGSTRYKIKGISVTEL